MAGINSRTILVCSFPAIITLLTFLWVRKKKKSQVINFIDSSIGSENQNVLDSNKESVSCKAEPLVSISEPLTPKFTMGEEKRQKLKLVETEPLALIKEQISNPQDASIAAMSDLSISPKSEQEFSVCDQLSKKLFLQSPEEEILLEAQSSETSINSVILAETNRDIPSYVIEDLEKVHILEEEVLNTLNQMALPEISQLEDHKSSNVDTYQELDIIESPPPSIYSDGQSEDSSDSGKGGSDIQGSNSNYDFSSSPLSSNEDPLHLQVYEFELAQELCGRLIGRLGKNVNFIKSRTNANVYIKRHPFNPPMKICSIEGTHAEIKSALELIRKRFPVNQFSNVTLVQVNLPLTCGIMVPETLQLNLPVGVTCDVILSSMVSTGHFFIQQPTHPTYPSLSRLDLCMSSCYSQIDTPSMPQPVEVGVICSAPTMGGWYRAQVVNIYESSEECDIKFVDYGGYSCIPLASLRQIRSDFMTLPFQASECYLANVRPIDDVTSDDANETQQTVSWSIDSCAMFEELAQGQILQALVVGHAEDGVPFVHLYRVQGVSTVFINKELVNRGIAQWIEQRQA